MAHVVSTPCGMSARRLAERHLKSHDNESVRQLEENLQRNNPGKLSNGTAKLPALIVTPDGTSIDNQEERDCERLSKDLDRLQKRLGPKNYRKLVELTNTAGPEALSVVMAAERWVQKHKDSLSTGQTLAGGAVSGARTRLDDFGKSLARYEDALNTYLLSKHSPASQRFKAREAAARAFQDLNSRFAAELGTMAQSSRYKNWVQNPFRSFAGGVESSMNTSGSPISSLPEAKRLKMGLGATRVLGKGLFAVDLVGRGFRVASSDNKDYTFAKEATSFTVSAVVTSVVVRGAAFGLSLALGPTGLVLLISVISIGALTAYSTDLITRSLFDDTAEALLE